MFKEVEVVEQGFEKVVDVLKENIETINAAQEKEIAEATEQIKTKYENILNRYNEELSHLVHTETIEVEDEVEIETEVETAIEEEKTYIGE